jgi:hypothetical protein
MFYKSMFYKSSPCFTSPVHVLQVHVLQVQSMFNKSSPCFTSPVHVLQVQSIVYKSSPRSSQCFITSCPRGIVNRVVILNTTLNKHYVFQSTWKLSATQEVLLKVEITANIASLQPNVAVCKVIWKASNIYYSNQIAYRSFLSWNLDRVVEPAASQVVNSLLMNFRLR